MIRLVQRKLIIPRGDTGNFSLPVPKEANTGDVAVFTIIDPRTNTKVYEKITEPVEQLITIVFTHNDTVNLPVGRYLWDVKFYVNPSFADEKLVNGDEVDSYYAAYTLPECEVRQTGDDLMTSDDSPSSTLTPESLNIITAAITEATQAKNAAAASAAEAQGYVEQITELSAEAETLPAGASATAAYDAETGVLTLGLPRGDAFSVAKTYPTIAAMNADYSGSDTSVGDFVMIVSTIGDPDNAKLYVKGAERFEFVVDMSGANGVGVQSIVKSGTVENVDTYTITYTDGTTTTYNVVNGVDGDEYTVMVQDTQPTQETNKLWIPISQGVVQEVPTVQEMNAAIAAINVPVEDVQVNGVSVVEDGVADVNLNNYLQKTDYADGTNVGPIRVNANYGLVNVSFQDAVTGESTTYTAVMEATVANIKEGTDRYRIISSRRLPNATFYGLARAAGDTTQSQSSNPVGTYTDEAKTAIKSMIGVTDGFSPSASVTQTATGATISITDKQGTTTANIENGTDGTDGEDGYSPTVTVTDITGGHRVTVTDADGAHTFDVMDGTGSVQDVQVNGTSVVTDGVAEIPIAADFVPGVVKVNNAYGMAMVRGYIAPLGASSAQIKGGAYSYREIVPACQHEVVYYGLAKAAGADMANVSGETVGVYPEAQKSAISTMLNSPVSVTGTTPTITALSGIQYVCGEVSTLDITLPESGIVDVVFESGSTPTVLTVTPPTGVTVKWANGFDPTSLEANTTYELNIKDGLGVAGAWS